MVLYGKSAHFPLHKTKPMCFGEEFCERKLYYFPSILLFIKHLTLKGKKSTNCHKKAHYKLNQSV